MCGSSLGPSHINIFLPHTHQRLFMSFVGFPSISSTCLTCQAADGQLACSFAARRCCAFLICLHFAIRSFPSPHQPCAPPSHSLINSKPTAISPSCPLERLPSPCPHPLGRPQRLSVDLPHGSHCHSTLPPTHPTPFTQVPASPHVPPSPITPHPLPTSPGPSARWLRALHPGAAARDRILAPFLLLQRPLPLAVAAHFDLFDPGQTLQQQQQQLFDAGQTLQPQPQQGQGSPGVVAGSVGAGAAAAISWSGVGVSMTSAGDMRTWLRGLEASAGRAVWALDQR